MMSATERYWKSAKRVRKVNIASPETKIDKLMQFFCSFFLGMVE